MGGTQDGMAGPLAGFRGGFEERLGEVGYTPSSAVGQLRLMADLSGWLAVEGLGGAGFTSEAADRFIAERGAAGQRAHRSPRGLAPLLEYLRELGAVPAASAPCAWTDEERLLAEYRCYLVQERGLAAGTVRNHIGAARAFLSWLPDGAGDGEAGQLCSGDVTAFVLALARVQGGPPRSARNLVSACTGLRSLLRFLFLTGRTETSLAAAVPPAARCRGGSLPRALDARWVSSLLDGCDLQRAVGRRDFAILTVLVRLGLRSGEVAALLLDDVDWRAGELLVRGKANRQERLPVAHDVGEAITGYLRDGRPPSPCRNVFLRAVAPRVQMTAGAVGMVVALACDRAGLARVGAHRLRHTAATEMLRHGASLPEIGQVLRHRRMETTAIYAKVDRAALAGLARPWPGGLS